MIGSISRIGEVSANMISLYDEGVNKKLIVVSMEIVVFPSSRTVLDFLLEVATRAHSVDGLGFEIRGVKGDSLLLIVRLNIGSIVFEARKPFILLSILTILNIICCCLVCRQL